MFINYKAQGTLIAANLLDRDPGYATVTSNKEDKKKFFVILVKCDFEFVVSYYFDGEEEWFHGSYYDLNEITDAFDRFVKKSKIWIYQRQQEIKDN